MFDILLLLLLFLFLYNINHIIVHKVHWQRFISLFMVKIIIKWKKINFRCFAKIVEDNCLEIIIIIISKKIFFSVFNNSLAIIIEFLFFFMAINLIYSDYFIDY